MERIIEGYKLKLDLMGDYDREVFLENIIRGLTSSLYESMDNENIHLGLHIDELGSVLDNILLYTLSIDNFGIVWEEFLKKNEGCIKEGKLFNENDSATYGLLIDIAIECLTDGERDRPLKLLSIFSATCDLINIYSNSLGDILLEIRRPFDYIKYENIEFDA